MGGGDWVDIPQQVQMPIEPEPCESIVCALREWDFSTVAIIVVGVAIVTAAKVIIERYLKGHKSD